MWNLCGVPQFQLPQRTPALKEKNRRVLQDGRPGVAPRLRLRRSWQRTPPPGCSHHRTRGKNLHHQNRAQGASRARTSLQLTKATRQRRITLLLQQDWPPNINYDKLLTRAHLFKPLARLHTGFGGQKQHLYCRAVSSANPSSCVVKIPVQFGQRRQHRPPHAIHTPGVHPAGCTSQTRAYSA